MEGNDKRHSRSRYDLLASTASLNAFDSSQKKTQILTDISQARHMPYISALTKSLSKRWAGMSGMRIIPWLLVRSFILWANRQYAAQI